jgi:hypothetical protein
MYVSKIKINIYVIGIFIFGVFTYYTILYELCKKIIKLNLFICFRNSFKQM